MAHLTLRQQQILNYIDSTIEDRGFPPTLREICQKFRIASTNGARYHIQQLKKLGFLEVEPGKSRGVRRLETNHHKRSYTMPILGRIPAGPFDLASPDIHEDELTVDPVYFGSRQNDSELFGLRVKGDSMEDEGIFEGDIVVVHTQDHAQTGDIVVARLEDEATVKKFRQGENEIILEPANSKYQPIHIKDQGGSDFGQDFALLGRVVGLIRSI